MLRLDTLGGLGLLDPTGVPLPVPRLRLAVLAQLAVAGARGLTRDKLVAFLWPERSADNARHSLEQLLYAMRRQLPKDLVAGVDPLRLNPALVSTDVAEFEQAAAIGDRERVIALYRGPFLDGFFLSESPEFEEWAERERDRLARVYARALHDLAREYGSSGRHTAEIECWRRLGGVEPLSERAAAGLVRALGAAGEWPAALEHARRYDALVGQDLGGRHPSLSLLVERLRQEREPAAEEPSPGLRYRIMREIGRGTMAVVYQAWDAQLGRNVALKVLRPELAGSTAADRFQREIAILASLRHPHILPIHDSGLLLSDERPNGPFFVMPYIEGETLRGRLGRELRLPLPEVARLGAQLGEALDYAHRRGIVHRDIKPENILLDSGHALLADFGVAYAVDLASGHSLSLSGVRVGAPGYMSPEQAAGAPVDARSDVYSFACVVYEMLAGEPPFTGPTAQAVVARHAADPVRPVRTVRPEVPAALDGVLRTAMAKAPRERYASAGRFVEAVREAIGPAA